jgi:hypothetical protein
MIILKQQVAGRRRSIHNGEALARIRERRGQEEAASHRAAAWRAATKRLDDEHMKIAWEMREEEAQHQVHTVMLERESHTLLKAAKNRARTGKVEERLRIIQERRKLKKQDIIAGAEAKAWLANYRLVENEKQTLQKLDEMENRYDEAHARVLERKAHLEAARAEHYALEHDVGEARRNAGVEWAQNMRLAAHQALAEENNQKSERSRAHAELASVADAETRRAIEADLTERFEAAVMRRQQTVLELREMIAQRADARELATAECQERKDMLYRIAHEEKVQEAVAREQLGQMAVDFRRAELDEKVMQKAILNQEAQASARLRRLEEKEDGHLQALADMEEAKEILESYAIDVDLVGIKVEGNKDLAIENSLLNHERSNRRLMDHCSAEEMCLVDVNGDAF